METAQRTATFQALAAAALFGASAPIAKLLLGQVDPMFLAGFLYLGSGAGILLFKLLLSSRLPMRNPKPSCRARMFRG